MVYTPQGDNAAADSLSNRALDHGDFRICYLDEVPNFCKCLLEDRDGVVGLVFSFDGASRNNPGMASHGNSAWWGVFGPHGFTQKGLLFEGGCQLGARTNNFAEARGLAFAVKASLHFHFWFLDLCARLEARRVYI